jgi:hypothetical protein
MFVFGNIYLSAILRLAWEWQLQHPQGYATK